MNRTTGRSAFLSLLKDEGITHLFGNPGTTELPVMHALKDHPELTYVMAMQESLVVAMADGYAQRTRNAAFVNLHSAAGLGHALGNIFTAYRNQTSDGIWREYEITALDPGTMFVLSRNDGSYHVKYSLKPAAGGTELEYLEWTDAGELEEPFTQEALDKLKQVMEAD